MKNLISLKFIILVHVAFYLLSQCSADLVQTCKKTPYVNLCVSTLNSDPKSATADVAGLAVIGANILSPKANDTLNQINELLKGATDPQVQNALKSCAEKYSVIVKYEMPVVIEAVTKGNPKFGSESATDAANEANSCENGFTTSPITSQNKFVHDFALVLASIVSILL